MAYTVRLYNRKYAQDIGLTNGYISAEKYGFDDLIIVPVTDWGYPISESTIQNRFNQTIEQFVEDALEELSCRPIVLTDMLGLPREAFDVYVLTTGRQYGAIGGIVAQKWLKEKFPDGYVLIPSSVHEMLAMPLSEVDNEKLLNTIFEINTNTLTNAERLSNNYYIFN